MKTTKISPVVQEIGEIHFEGNIVPHTWFQHPALRLESGSLNLIAIIVLSHLAYWHRPAVTLDEVTGDIRSVRNRFSGEKYRAQYDAIARRYGLSKRQVQEAVTFLVARNIIERDIVDKVPTDTGTIYNVVYLTPVPHMIRELCQLPIDGSQSEPSDTPLPLQCEGGAENENGDDTGEGAPIVASPLSPYDGTPPTSQRMPPHTAEYPPSQPGVTPPTLQRAPLNEISMENPTEIPPKISMENPTQTPAEHRAPKPASASDVPVVGLDKNMDQVGEGESLTRRLEALGIDTDCATVLIRRFDSGTVDEAISSIATRKSIREANSPTAYLRKVCEKKEEAAEKRAASAEERKRVVSAPRKATIPTQDTPSSRPTSIPQVSSPDTAYAALSDSERAVLDEESWARAMRDAPAPIRAKLEAAAKAQEPAEKMVRGLLLMARNALLAEREAAEEAARKRQIDMDFS
jgi:hypothetical protein